MRLHSIFYLKIKALFIKCYSFSLEFSHFLSSRFIYFTVEYALSQVTLWHGRSIIPWSQNQHVYRCRCTCTFFFKKAQLLTRLSSISSVQSLESQFVYLFDQALNEQQQQSALQLLNDGQSFELHQAASDEIQILVTPRVGTISPWSSKATDIFANCNTPVHRLERGVLFTLKGEKELKEALQILHDRMTESFFNAIEDAAVLFTETARNL